MRQTKSAETKIFLEGLNDKKNFKIIEQILCFLENTNTLSKKQKKYLFLQKVFFILLIY